MRSKGTTYQYVLIFLFVVSAGLFGIFTLRELFPEYRIYQNKYLELEHLRAKYTGSQVAPFKKGIKQVVLPASDKGPEAIDRCTSCHVALDLPHFSPFKVQTDFNGKVVRNTFGQPLMTPNKGYIWGILKNEIIALRDPKVIEKLQKDGNTAEVSRRLDKADELESHFTKKVNGESVDMTRVLAMHPLIGKEERPFEFHPVEEFGCTSCHMGNGRGLVSDRSHGPVFDEDYEHAHHGPSPHFIEKDPLNDPSFARVFNHKPGHRLLFHTEPLFVGGLMEAKCVNCHSSSSEALQAIVTTAKQATQDKEKELSALKTSLNEDKWALIHLFGTKKMIEQKGVQKTLDFLKDKTQDFQQPIAKYERFNGNYKFLKNLASKDKDNVLASLDREIERSIGSVSIKKALEGKIDFENTTPDSLTSLLSEQRGNREASGDLFRKWKEYENSKNQLAKVDMAKETFEEFTENKKIVEAVSSDISRSLKHYSHGKQLFVSNACMACHKIEGFSRGGIGPELTQIGLSYPWYIKESIVWPQANLATSTMPNFKLDHEEVEALMAFLLSQTGESNVRSSVQRKTWVKAWEGGEKVEWEKPLAPYKIKDLRASMKIFAVEGCASCHQLKGFESNVGFAVDKQGASFKEKYDEEKWFQHLFPQYTSGGQIVEALDSQKDEIDRRIIDGVQQNGILEEIEEEYPGVIEGFFTPFKFALRAKNDTYHKLIEESKSEEEKEKYKQELLNYQARVRRVLMTYIQVYGLGRNIGPILHWSGIYRDQEWLIGHFRNPSSHTAKSIMPVLPFDDSKFYALTFMLEELAKKNRDASRQIWAERGFDPKEAYSIHCASCHGEFLYGNGPIAEWIYPIPKNLRNGTFLRNLTKERAVQSILHGVQGGPMPPWGEVHETGGDPVLTEDEIRQLVDWLYLPLPGGQFLQSEKDIKKWQYDLEDVVDELKKEGGNLKGKQETPLSMKSSSLDLNALYASTDIRKAVRENQTDLSVEDLFEEREPLEAGGEKRYFIRKEFFTEANIQEGEHLFQTNCAHCHGKGADGTGLRAGTMKDAKPRMLTNLRWVETRDDLRLLRSIKFGVPGTSMTPWGDKTSTLQRLQMTVFIRNLTEEKRLREELADRLYKSFEQSKIAIQKFRSGFAQNIRANERNYHDLKENRQNLQLALNGGSPSPSELAQAYQKEIEALNKLERGKEADQVLKQLMNLVEEEKSHFEKLGFALITLDGAELVEDYLSLFDQGEPAFSNNNEDLILKNSEKILKEFEDSKKQLLYTLNKTIEKFKKEEEVVSAQLPSAEKQERLSVINARLKSFTDLRNSVISAFSEGRRLRSEQAEAFNTFKAQSRNLMG